MTRLGGTLTFPMISEPIEGFILVEVLRLVCIPDFGLPSPSDIGLQLPPCSPVLDLAVAQAGKGMDRWGAADRYISL
jgi:hypothetical protein